MPLLRSIFLLSILWVQALPGATGWRWLVDEPATCTMSCCAAVGEMEAVDACGCLDSSEGAPVEPAPAGLPSGSGRDLVPAVAWANLASGLSWLDCAPAAHELAPQVSPSLDSRPPPPHVRLPVLFCSFLT